MAEVEKLQNYVFALVCVCVCVDAQVAVGLGSAELSEVTKATRMQRNLFGTVCTV